VRCRAGTFQWPAQGDCKQRAYFDLADAVEDIIRLHEDMAARDAAGPDVTEELEIRAGAPTS
jgi:hypothetical protein